jgi:hypothetical protein
MKEIAIVDTDRGQKRMRLYYQENTVAKLDLDSNEWLHLKVSFHHKHYGEMHSFSVRSFGPKTLAWNFKLLSHYMEIDVLDGNSFPVDIKLYEPEK